MLLTCDARDFPIFVLASAERTSMDQAATTKAGVWLAELDRALARGDATAALALFADDCYWRDFLS
jgi:hypothetical protein